MHPVLEYALTILSPHHACKFKMPPQLARFVFRRTLNVTAMLDNLHWPTFETQRQRAKLLSLLANQNCVPLLVVIDFRLFSWHQKSLSI